MKNTMIKLSKELNKNKKQSHLKITTLKLQKSYGIKLN